MYTRVGGQRLFLLCTKPLAFSCRATDGLTDFGACWTEGEEVFCCPLFFCLSVTFLRCREVDRFRFFRFSFLEAL